MVDLELSTIPDSEFEQSTLLSMVRKFGQKNNAKVDIRPLTWGAAWAELLTIASHGKGPDVSHIGGTWVSSLATMNALRSFQLGEIKDVGNEASFLPAVWQSTTLPNDKRVWSMPWTSYIYVICYRKDLLGKAGIDVSKGFGSIESLHDTVSRLSHSSLEIPWLHPNIPAPYTDLLHVAASWVWGAGGDFIDDEGRKVIFDSGEALKGLKFWLEIYRAVPESYKNLDWNQTVQLFSEGRAAAVLTDIRTAYGFFGGKGSEEMRSNLGVATLTDVPWVGGGSFIVWQHTLGYPEKERAALDLVKHLVSYEAELAWCQTVHSMPSRKDVIDAMYPKDSPLHEAVSIAVSNGRAYHNVPLWRRVEFQLSQELGAVVQDARENRSSSPESILERHLGPLAQRLNLTLGN